MQARRRRSLERLKMARIATEFRYAAIKEIDYRPLMAVSFLSTISPLPASVLGSQFSRWSYNI
jgi:hypothetical protein